MDLLRLSSDGFGRGTTRAEDAQGTPTHISPSILYEDEDLGNRGVAVEGLMGNENHYTIGPY